MTTYRAVFDELPAAFFHAETMDDLTRGISDYVQTFLDTDDFTVSVHEDLSGQEPLTGTIEDGRRGSFSIEVVSE